MAKDNKPEITIAQNAGFCKGVKSVIEKLDKALESGPHPVFTIGEVVHNSRVVSEYESKGARVVHSPAELPDNATVVVRAHGLPINLLEILGKRELKIIDGTCPRVKIVHWYIREALKKGHVIILGGYEKHAETQGHASLGKDRIFVVETADELETLDLPDATVAFLAQTTFDRNEFSSMEHFLEKKYGSNLKVHDTICLHTVEAQKSAMEVARNVDAMVVVGSANSENTKRLTERCREVCKKVFQVESVEELEMAALGKFKKIGITGGSSTPMRDIDDIAASISGE